LLSASRCRSASADVGFAQVRGFSACDVDERHNVTFSAAMTRYAPMMKTGVPIRTCWNIHSASGIAMRMQPCETE
jgi:hypothetical protein